MIRIFTAFLAITSFAVFAAAANKKLQLKNLPPAVQKTVQAETKGAEIKSIGKETVVGWAIQPANPLSSGSRRG